MAFSSGKRVLPWAIVAAVAGSTAVSWLLSRELGEADRELLGLILGAFGCLTSASELKEFLAPQPVAAWVVALNLAAGIGLAACAVAVGLLLPAVPRLLAALQTFVASLLLIWAEWSWFSAGGRPVFYFSAVVTGCLAGYGLRLLAGQRAKAQAQYYEIAIKNKELQETKLQIVKQDEVERRMLAADLHDQVLNDLKEIGRRFDAYVAAPEPDSVEPIKSLLGQAMGEVREVMDSLCPSTLEHLGLGAAIEDCLKRGGERAGFKARFRSRLEGSELDSLSMVEKSLVYRLVQESITNVCKHAQAKTVRASMEMDGGHLVIAVADDGRGIDPAKLRDDSRGVRYMRQRADLIGATIAWRKGENDKGTVVEIRMDMAGRDNDKNSRS